MLSLYFHTIFRKIARNRRAYKAVERNRELEMLEIDTWESSRFILGELVPIVGVSPYPLNELMLMTGAVCWLKPELIFDWGTHIGKSARIFYEITRHFKISSEVHTIDLPQNARHIEHPGKNRGIYIKGIKSILSYDGDGVTEAVKIYKEKHKKKALFFLDGDHKYTSVKRELERITKNAPNSSVLIHDTFFQSKESSYNIGPFRAIETVIKKYSSRYKKIETQTGLPGMTLLYQK